MSVNDEEVGKAAVHKPALSHLGPTWRFLMQVGGLWPFSFLQLCIQLANFGPKCPPPPPLPNHFPEVGVGDGWGRQDILISCWAQNCKNGPKVAIFGPKLPLEKKVGQSGLRRPKFYLARNVWGGSARLSSGCDLGLGSCSSVALRWGCWVGFALLVGGWGGWWRGSLDYVSLWEGQAHHRRESDCAMMGHGPFPHANCRFQGPSSLAPFPRTPKHHFSIESAISCGKSGHPVGGHPVAKLTACTWNPERRKGSSLIAAHAFPFLGTTGLEAGAVGGLAFCNPFNSPPQEWQKTNQDLYRKATENQVS